MAMPTPLKARDTMTKDTLPAIPSQERLSPGEIMERVMIKGDLSKLTPHERAGYYSRVCESIGLNPLTRPFEYITLNSKLTLYARRDATDQLRRIHNVSVVEVTQEEMEGVYIVVCKVQDKDGRTDIARGAVAITGLKGEALANALMKTETKAKRRATLSICGLGFLDETEIEDIGGPKRKSSSGAKKDGTTETFNEIRRQIQAATDVEYLRQIRDLYAEERATLPPAWELILSQEFEDRWKDLGGDGDDVAE